MNDGTPEAFALFFGGERSHGAVFFCVADRRFRLKNPAPGEVALCDDPGRKARLTRSGIAAGTAGDD